MNGPTGEMFRDQLTNIVATHQDIGLSAAATADDVIHLMVNRLSALVIQLDGNDPACALLRAEIRDIQAGAQ